MRDADGVPTFDVVVLGIGDDGHTASLFPGEPTVDITNRFVAAVPPGPGREARLTLTRSVIEHARSVFVLAVGASKRPALDCVWAAEGDVHVTPTRIVRECKAQRDLDRGLGGDRRDAVTPMVRWVASGNLWQKEGR